MKDPADRISTAWLALWLTLLCAGMVVAGRIWPEVFSPANAGLDLSLTSLAGGATGAANHDRPMFASAWLEMIKLLAAGLIGMVVTSVHRRYHGDRAPNRSLMQAAVLLCIAGALMMIIIGNSTARALGVAGGASIIRFRTPIDDPKDAMLLLLVLGLGMSLGLGAFSVCGLATLFLCLFLIGLDRFGEVKPRTLMLDLVSSTNAFPLDHVNDVLRSSVEFYEPVKFAQGNEAAMRFSVKVAAGSSLAWISDQLMAKGQGGLKSVSWEAVKKSEQ